MRKRNARLLLKVETVRKLDSNHLRMGLGAEPENDDFPPQGGTLVCGPGTNNSPTQTCVPCIILLPVP